MNKHGIRLITAVVTSSMIVTPVLAAPSVDDLKKEKAAKQSEVSSLQSQLTTLMGKVNTLESELIQTGEDITKAQGDSILRADLRKLCRMFSYLGRDSLLAAVLSYNVGPYRLKGYGKRPKSRLLKKLESGDRNIYKEYVSFRCYKGKVVPSIERRRKVEFMLLFEE